MFIKVVKVDRNEESLSSIFSTKSNSGMLFSVFYNVHFKVSTITYQLFPNCNTGSAQIAIKIFWHILL